MFNKFNEETTKTDIKPQPKQPELNRKTPETDNYIAKPNTITITKEELAQLVQTEIEKKELDKRYSF